MVKQNKSITLSLTWKRIAIGVITFIILIAVTFGAGTFIPNKWTSKRIMNEIEMKVISQFSQLDLHMPSISYSTNAEFITAVNRCINFVNLTTPYTQRVHRDIIIGMAILETDYGKSRFANVANNLFGIRTWSPDVPQVKPADLPNAKFGVRKFPSKCHSVQEMIRLINEHPAYAEYRFVRKDQYENNRLDLTEQINGLQKWSTNPEYTNLVIRSINEIEGILEKGLQK
jgi:Bax protein